MSEVVLITGADGLLGSEFRSISASSVRGRKILGKSHRELDITDLRQVRRNVEELRPNFIVNCAAYRDIDKAESDRDSAYRVNVEGPRNLAEISRQAGVKLVHFSTHGVFDGEKAGPYLESDAVFPLNHYAATKLEGERVVASILPQAQCLVLRVAWPFGAKGNNFIHQILERAKRQPEIRVVADQIGVPNPARLLAAKTLELLDQADGLFHLSCLGSCSRFELMAFLVEALKLNCHLIPVTAAEFPTIAKRPRNMAIATERETIAKKLEMPHWREALSQYLAEGKNLT